MKEKNSPWSTKSTRTIWIFKKKHISNEETNDQEIDRDKLNSDNVQEILDSPFTTQETENCIKQLKNNKSPGIDEVLNEYILHIQAISCYLYITN